MHLRAVQCIWVHSPRRPARRLVRPTPPSLQPAPGQGPKNQPARSQKELLGRFYFRVLLPTDLPSPSFSLWYFGYLAFFYQQIKKATHCHCIADKTYYFSCQKCCPIFGLTSSLLHPAPSQPVTLSKPTAFLGHYPSRGSAVLWLDTPTLFSQITTHNLA